jgi:hypothetical protein
MTRKLVATAAARSALDQIKDAGLHLRNVFPKAKTRKSGRMAGAYVSGDTAPLPQDRRPGKPTETIAVDPGVTQHGLAQGFVSFFGDLERARMRKATLAIAANPLAERDRRPVWPTAPTPQRHAKMTNGVTKTVVIPGADKVPAVSTHREKPPMEKFENHFTADELAVYHLFTRQAERVTQANLARTTSNYEGVSGGGQGPRSGSVPDRLRNDYQMFQWVWTHLEYRHKVVAWRMVLAERFDTTGQMMTPEDLGKLCSNFSDKATRKGIALGLIKGTLWSLEDLYRRYRAMIDEKKAVADAVAPRQIGWRR